MNQATPPPMAHHAVPRPNRFSRRIGAGAFFIALHISALAQEIGFDEAIRTAVERAATLQGRIASVQGAAALETNAAQLPDPKLSLGIADFPVTGPNKGSLTRDDFTMRQIGYAQDVPNRAKRAARSDAALARTEREQALLRVEHQSVRREAGLAWLASHFAQRRLALYDELNSHHQLLQQTAPAQFAAGKISAADVTMVELEGLALADRKDELQREATQATVMLTRWVGAPVSTGIAAKSAASPPTFLVDREYLLSNLARNPEVEALTPMRAMAEAELREAEAAQTGDWSWSVGYGKRGQGYGDLVSAQVTFELPVATGKRQEPQIRARQKELTRIDAERDELLRRHTQEIDTLWAESTELQHKLQRLTQQALPLATQRTAYSLAAYESGKGTLTNVQEARKQQSDIGLRTLELESRLRAVQWRLTTLVPEQSP